LTDTQLPSTCCEWRIPAHQWQDPAWLQAATAAAGIGLPEALGRAVPKRQAEFLAGRLCALHALQRAGHVGSGLVGIGPLRAPVWPPGFVGSIAHYPGEAWAVAASVANFRGLGIDVEAVFSERTAAELGANIVCPEELELQRHGAWHHRLFLTVAFSAKESLFKCLAPTSGVYFDFHDAHLTRLAPGRGTLTLQLKRTLSSALPAGMALHGGLSLEGEAVRTWVLWPTAHADH
jgi:enterobactin synthetase component D